MKLLNACVLLLLTHTLAALQFKGDPVDINTPEGKELLETIASPTNPKFPRRLTSKVAEIYEHVVAVALKNPDQTPVPADMMATSGKFLRGIVAYGDTDSHCPQMHFPELLKAKEEILVAMYLFDWRTNCVKSVIKALKVLNKRLEGSGRKIRAWFVVSTVSMISYGRHSWQTRWNMNNVYTERSEIDPRAFTFPSAHKLKNIDLRVKTYHQFVLGAMHTKLVIIDGRRVITGSKNIDLETGSEISVLLEGSLAMPARADFEELWGEGPLPELTRAITKPMPGDVPMIYVGRTEDAIFFHDREDNPQDQAWIGAMKLATKNIFIETPNFIARKAVDVAVEAAIRGVRVSIVTSYYMADEAQMLYLHSCNSFNV